MFTKNDLRSVDFIVRRNGSIEVYLESPFEHFICKDGGYNRLYNMEDNLLSKSFCDFDIMMVYRPVTAALCSFDHFKRSSVVFDRKKDCNETIMTISEIESCLGIKNLKIVKEQTQ